MYKYTMNWKTINIPDSLEDFKMSQKLEFVKIDQKMSHL